MVKHLPKYYVFLDSNAMLGRRWVKAALFEQIKELKGEQLAEVKFFVPGIVCQEWSRHYIDDAQRHIRKISGSQGELMKMGISTVDVTGITEADLQARADKILEQNSIYVIDTPYETIDWPDLIDRAVKHTPPFAPDSDKGIKDALVAHTIHAYYTKHKQRKAAQFITITKDGILSEYLKVLLDTPDFVIHGTLEDFASSLRLQVDKLSSDLLSKAKSTFYTNGDKESLYYKADVHKIIQGEYDKLLSNSPSAESHIRKLPAENISGAYSLPSDDSWSTLDNRCFITGTSFIRKGGGRLHWTTSVTYKQAYALSSQNYDGLVINNPAAVFHSVNFEVNWSSSVKSEHTLKAPRLSSVKLIDEGASVEMFPGIDYEKGVTRLTRPSGAQGLASVAQSLSQLAPQSSLISPSLAATLNSMKDSFGPSIAAIKSIQDSINASQFPGYLTGLNGSVGANISVSTEKEDPNPSEDKAKNEQGPKSKDDKDKKK